MPIDTVAIAWPEVLSAIGSRRASAGSSAILDDAEGLSALFTRDYASGAARLAGVRDADPLNPLHTLRLALFRMRFGQWDAALGACAAIQDLLPGHPLPVFLRALATLRLEEPKRAANIAAEVITASPTFGLARFLQAEALLRSQFRGLKKLLGELPGDIAYAPAWADLLAKMTLAPSDEGAKLVAQTLPKNRALKEAHRARGLVEGLLQLTQVDLDGFEARLLSLPSGSRAEQVAILVLHDRLIAAGPLTAAADQVRQMVDRAGDRPAIRRLYVMLLTRLAMDHASKERYTDAMRLVERCLALEPHGTTHLLNRAALFTLMREIDSYHDAWFNLARHHFRLALLGKFTSADASAMTRLHRMFAQQARFQPEPPGTRRPRNAGLFIETPRAGGEPGDLMTAVNQDRIDDDPELLRQWVHHRRAELALAHWALGPDPDQFLLAPESPRMGAARVEGLAALAESMATLVPEEGRMLADRMVKSWRAWGVRAGSSYAAAGNDPDLARLRAEHVETVADLALLCLSWRPDGRRPQLVAELVAFLDAEAPFFDESALDEALNDKDRVRPYPLKILAFQIDNILGLDPARKHTLTVDQRRRVLDSLAADLYARLAFRTYEAHRGATDAARRALEFADRARQLAPENPRHELTVARFLLLGDFYDEAEEALARLHRSARARDPEVLSEVEDLKKFLDDRSTSRDRGRVREVPRPGLAIDPADRVDLADLEAEIERFPSSIQAYEELARALAARGSMADAVLWSDRAIASCLARDPQLRARSLNLEILGLEALARTHPQAVKLYLAGIHRPALEQIGSIPVADDTPYPVDYLLGHCRLALNQPEEAREAFERALGRCTRQLHRTVLRGLATDVDGAYLVVARRLIREKLNFGAYAEALGEAAGMMRRLRRPEAALVDLARVELDAATAGIGTATGPLPVPSLGEADLSGRIGEAFEAPTDLLRARRLVELGIDLAQDEPARKPLEAILAGVEALERQSVVAAALAESGDLLRGGRFVEALASLDAAGGLGINEPRVLRQRALLLLRLDRFDEADAVADRLAGDSSAVAREFAASYPALVFRQRLNAGCRLIRVGDADGALRVLRDAVATRPDDLLELAYCRGFALAMDGRRLKNEGRAVESRARLAEAMRQIDGHLTAAQNAGHARLLELYTTLDKDLDE